MTPPSKTIRSISPAVLDRARGALLGLAVGDALGTTLEFSARDSLPHHTEMTGGGPFGLIPGGWTDDTSMALALADSLIACRAFDAADLMTRFVAWWRSGAYSHTGTCFDIGITTAQALAHSERTGEPFAGSADEDQAGNGSLMRLAPVVLFHLHDVQATEQLARAQSRTTHAAPQCLDACALFSRILRDAILDEPNPLRERRTEAHPAVRAIAAGSWRGKSRPQIHSSGYVVHTLEAALWAVGTTTSFEAALIAAVNLGEDADTVGAVTGQLAGALYGASAIPERWIAPLAWREQVTATADTLLAVGQEVAHAASSRAGLRPNGNP
ncbi:ADP-ribosyl-(dinitrogen reductase) hydrolase [Methylobacterium sp. Leaf456]|nr:ADP-ribosyl-(dinitrogen reductase) hydrolase [Methylobacterium sp. Leaf456]